MFTVPTGEKVTEKQLYRVLLSSICSILLCMTCLVSTTWAWFTTTITSEQNMIEIGTFDPKITISPSGYENLANGSYSLPVGAYTVTVSNAGTGKGYCELWLQDTKYTTPILTPMSDSAEENITFTIQVNAADGVRMTVVPHWGTPPEGSAALPENITVGNASAASTEASEATTAPSNEPSAPEQTTEPAAEPSVPAETTTAPEATEGATEPSEVATEPSAAPEQTTEPSEATEPSAPES